MQRYVLTDRGKLLIAMLIILFIILMSVIIIGQSLMRFKSSNESIDGSNDIHQNKTDPVSPEPDLENATDEEQAPQNNGIDIETMSFRFSPGLQTDLDDETVTKLGQFLMSSKNTKDSKISVEIPLLADDDTAVITTAIINAFNIYEVPLSDIVFFVYQPEPATETFEINMSFY